MFVKDNAHNMILGNKTSDKSCYRNWALKKMTSLMTIVIAHLTEFICLDSICDDIFIMDKTQRDHRNECVPAPAGLVLNVCSYY